MENHVGGAESDLKIIEYTRNRDSPSKWYAVASFVLEEHFNKKEASTTVLEN